MCGIVAAHGEFDPSQCERMLARLRHRGPDDRDWIQVGRAWLGHQRLSIVDLAGGRQPLANEEASRYLVANGEIYNHAQLRSGLQARHRFRTGSDNEVALHLVEEGGPAALAHLRGMFALVMASTDGQLVAARDPVGIKPLYWARQHGTVLFASELKAFDPQWQPFVETFPPGHYWTPAEGLVQFAAIPVPATPPLQAPLEGDLLEQTLTAVRESLIAAVERRMMADVPVGVFLSGGLDSSLVASIASRMAAREGRRIKSFAVGMANSPDLLAARVVAEYLGTEHHERIYTEEEAVAIVPEVIRMMESFDPSLVESAVANYMVAKLTAEHVKVVLTGEGADELFAGYDYLAQFATAEALQGEMVRTVEALHHLNLQRCDRTTMAHGLEGRVPFLDLEMIRLALSLPASWKLRTEGRPEKWLLRMAFTGFLPEEILWRKKLQFNDGSGMTSVLRTHLGGQVTEAEFQRERGLLEPPLASRAELAFYRLFQQDFGSLTVSKVIGRSPSAFAVQTVE